MTVTLNLNAEMEKDLIARAQERGVSLDRYIQELVAKEAGLQINNLAPVIRQFKNLSDLLMASPLVGANLDLERSKDSPRIVEPPI